MNTRKSLAKVFGPVLLLTATLALPVDTAQAAPHGRAAAHAQADQKHHKQEQRQAVAQRNRVQLQHVKVQQQRVKVQQQRVKNVRHEQALQRQAVHQQQVAQRQQAVARRQAAQQQALRRQQAVRLQTQRQRTLSRQQVIVTQPRQRVIVAQPRQRVVVTQPPARVYRNNRYYYYDPRTRTYYDPRYRAQRGGGGADRSVVAIDGYLDGGQDCLLLRDHEGRTWAMAGNTYGLEPGEHVRLYGRIVDGGVCGWEGTAFDIYEVQTVWADDHHKRTYYDHLYDGPFDQNRQYEDDRYYDDRGGTRNWWDRLFGN